VRRRGETPVNSCPAGPRLAPLCNLPNLERRIQQHAKLKHPPTLARQGESNCVDLTTACQGDSDRIMASFSSWRYSPRWRCEAWSASNRRRPGADHNKERRVASLRKNRADITGDHDTGKATVPNGAARTHARLGSTRAANDADSNKASARVPAVTAPLVSTERDADMVAITNQIATLTKAVLSLQRGFQQDPPRPQATNGGGARGGNHVQTTNRGRERESRPGKGRDRRGGALHNRNRFL
jgi:hypothetical protein